VLVVAYIDRLTEMSGSWLPWIWLLLFGVCTLGNFTDWFVALLLGALNWLFLLMILFDATILLFPVRKAGFWFWLTAWDLLRFF
jgi:hypothetical protein